MEYDKLTNTEKLELFKIAAEQRKRYIDDAKDFPSFDEYIGAIKQCIDSIVKHI